MADKDQFREDNGNDPGAARNPSYVCMIASHKIGTSIGMN
jgi:hypothetical protein